MEKPQLFRANFTARITFCAHHHKKINALNETAIIPPNHAQIARLIGQIKA
jgi:hypothetical protein